MILQTIGIFQNSVTERYDGTDATLEIIIMLLVAAILGYLLGQFLCNKKCKNCKDCSGSNASGLTSANVKKDNLQVIEGIGPKIEKLLFKNNIYTYKDIADSKASALNKILEDAGPRFSVHTAESWPEQAKLLVEGKMEAFKKLTDELKGGRYN